MEGIKTPEWKKELAVAKAIARRAGEIMLKYYHKDADQKVETKADDSPVTIADKEINRFVIEELAKHFPEDIVVGEEESTGGYGMGRRWFCDPVDGTQSFISRTPNAMFSLGLVVDGIPMMGVTFNPVTGDLFEATKNGGAYCNGVRIHVLGDTIGQIAIPSRVKKMVIPPKYVNKLIEKGFEPLSFNGAVNKTCLVARGKLIGSIANVQAHDMAAVHVILEEAGGKITSHDGKTLNYSQPFKGTVVSNGVIHDKLIECLKE